MDKNITRTRTICQDIDVNFPRAAIDAPEALLFQNLLSVIERSTVAADGYMMLMAEVC